MFMASQADIGLSHALVVQQRPTSATDHDMAIFQNVSALRYLQGLYNVLLDEHDREPLVLVYSCDCLKQFVYDAWRQAKRRLVEHDKAGISHQTSGHGQHLLFATRQCARRLRSS